MPSANRDMRAALASGTILNVALAAIDGEHNGHKPVGIRYFANMHKHKQLPSRVATCCENHGTHLLGALPQVTPHTSRCAASQADFARVGLILAEPIRRFVCLSAAHLLAAAARAAARPRRRRRHRRRRPRQLLRRVGADCRGAAGARAGLPVVRPEQCDRDGRHRLAARAAGRPKANHPSAFAQQLNKPFRCDFGSPYYI